MTHNTNLQTFLNSVATDATPNFKDLMQGIAEHYSVYHTLSPKQRGSVRVAANTQKKIVPVQFEEIKATDYSHDYIETESARLKHNQDKFLNSISKTTPEAIPPIVLDPTQPIDYTTAVLVKFMEDLMILCNDVLNRMKMKEPK